MKPAGGRPVRARPAPAPARLARARGDLALAVVIVVGFFVAVHRRSSGSCSRSGSGWASPSATRRSAEAGSAGRADRGARGDRRRGSERFGRAARRSSRARRRASRAIRSRGQRGRRAWQVLADQDAIQTLARSRRPSISTIGSRADAGRELHGRVRSVRAGGGLGTRGGLRWSCSAARSRAALGRGAARRRRS